MIRELIQTLRNLEGGSLRFEFGAVRAVRGPAAAARTFTPPWIYFPNMRIAPSVTFTGTSYANGSTLSANIAQAEMLRFQWLATATGGSTDEHPNCIECEDVRGKMKNVTRVQYEFVNSTRYVNADIGAYMWQDATRGAGVD